MKDQRKFDPNDETQEGINTHTFGRMHLVTAFRSFIELKS